MSGNYVHPEEGLLLRMQSGGGSLYVTARKVLVGLSILKTNGEEMYFEPTVGYDSAEGWDWSVTVQEAAERWLGDEYKDYNWRVKDSIGEYDVTLEDVLEFNYIEGGASFDKKYTYYTLIGTPKRVMVEVVLQGNAMEQKLFNQEIDSDTSIGSVLAGLGYAMGEGLQTCTKDGAEYSYGVDGYDGYPLPSSVSGMSWPWTAKIPCSIRIVIWKMN
jgi:hypothetical protein